MPLNPPSTASPDTASRVSTPWRSSSAIAWACTRSVREGVGTGDAPVPSSPSASTRAGASSTSDHRPAASGGPSDVRRPWRGRESRAGRFQRRARSGANVSFVTSPAQTRSHSASSASRSVRAPEAVNSSR